MKMALRQRVDEVDVLDVLDVVDVVDSTGETIFEAETQREAQRKKNLRGKTTFSMVAVQMDADFGHL
jgi:hypothetical protein